MRTVPVVDFHFLKILLPFHDTALGVNAGRCKPGTGGVEFLGKVGVHTENPCRLGGAAQQAADNLEIIGCADTQRRVVLLACFVGERVGILR